MQIQDTMNPKVAVVGAGHAHLTLLKNLNILTASGTEVTVVNTGDYHYYSGMGPGALSGRYSPEAIRFDVRKLTEDRGGRFISDRVTRIDPEARQIVLSSGQTVEYDVLTLNTGSHVTPLDTPQPESDRILTVKPIENLIRLKRWILSADCPNPVSITVAGGGAAGVETAANLKALERVLPGRLDVTVISSGSILSRFPGSVRDHALNHFSRHEIALAEDARVIDYRNGEVFLDSGDRHACDLLVLAIGTRPSGLAEASGLATGADGGLLVNTFLQSVSHPEIFGGGDCISFEAKPLDRVGVYAVRQNRLLLENVQAFLAGKPLAAFRPQRQYLLILNMGDGRGIVNRGNMTVSGRLGFWLKEVIDHRFMNTYQVSGETRKRGTPAGMDD